MLLNQTHFVCHAVKKSLNDEFCKREFIYKVSEHRERRASFKSAFPKAEFTYGTKKLGDLRCRAS
jgi:hypothetical protein